MRTLGRKPEQTKEQKIREMLRRATSMASAYSITGHLKDGKRKPRPVTLPKLKTLDQE